MKVLVINCGSSSIKYQLIDMDTEAVQAQGLVERIGEEMGSLSHKAWPDTDKEKKVEKTEPLPDHDTGMRQVIALLTDSEVGVIADTSEIAVCGHRIVHGGRFEAPMFVDDHVIEGLKEAIPLAPLHNPGHIAGILVAMELFPGVPQITVFDTAFHQTMEPKAYMYALPYEYYEKYHVRRYGFHGTSHRYVAKQLAQALNKPLSELTAITLHLGNGSSLTAIKNGKCVDTSMGLTPLAGVVMGTRTGSIDPSALPYIAQQKGLSFDELEHLIHKESGLKGLCGMMDLRDIHAAIDKGDERAKLALEMLIHSIRKYVGMYYANLGPLDAIAFTAGIGENDKVVREGVCANLDHMGIKMDPAKNNNAKGEVVPLHADDSQVKIFKIKTNEELEIANQCVELLASK